MKKKLSYQVTKTHFKPSKFKISEHGKIKMQTRQFRFYLSLK